MDAPREGRVVLDQYVAARAAYPAADFSFIGHSNDTYLFGSALIRCKAVRFKHAVLAGSVLRSNFKWKRLVANRQITAVWNYVDTLTGSSRFFPDCSNTFRSRI